MAVNFLQFLANFILAVLLLKIVELSLLRRDPESAVGQAIAFLVG